MQSIMVDMDDVLTYGNFTKILDDYLGYHPDYDHIKTYYIQDILGDKKSDFFDILGTIYEKVMKLFHGKSR